MAELEGSLTPEPTESVTPDTAVTDESSEITESDPPSTDPSDAVRTDESEPDNDGITPESDASETTTDAEDDTVQITRRNAKEIARKAISDWEAERKRADDLQAQLDSQRKAEESLTEEMTAFVGTDEEVNELRAKAMQRIPIVEDEFDTEAVRKQNDALRERDAAMERLEGLTRQRELLPKMMARTRAGFAQLVYDAFDSAANELDGVERAVFVDHLIAEDLQPAEVRTRLRAAFDHLYTTGKSAGAKEWKDRLEAERKQNSVKLAGAGGVPPSPESGGRPGTKRAFTRDDLANMSSAAYRANKQEIERQMAEGLIH
jgi:hypothetical protein